MKGVEFRVPRPIKTITAVSLLGYAALIYQQADDFDLAVPLQPVLHAEPAYTGGTAITTGTRGFYPTPPDAQIDVQIRAHIGGAATV